ncbi:protein toll-like [Polistes fuscatus]|uniref:protein toll-like n=1 Tax=Polistes fuscatus TaxID=30207 RepID=UPI001CA9615D|nr:protein toll-like [Polistes fuscatus]
MLQIGALAIFFLTITTINSTELLCEDNPHCRCISINPKVVHVSCHIGDNGTKILINVKSWDYLQINCENWDGWQDFNYTSNLAGHKVDSVQFINCGISDEISLRDVVDLFGVKETESLIYQSYKKLNGNLRRKHLAGFPKVKTLNLSGNGIINLTKDFLLDFPELEWIDLSENNVILHNKIFDPTPNLKRIELYNNGLTTFDIRLSPHIFSQLGELDVLDISMNNFSYDLQNVEKLELSNNLIKSLPDHIFQDMVKLEKLDLSGNNMIFITNNLFEGLTSLIILNIERNKLKVIEPMAFFPMKKLVVANIKNFITGWPIGEDNLRILDLSSNNITHVMANDFLIPSDRIRIDLRNNQIQNILFHMKLIPSQFFNIPHDITIFIDGNPILCDCKLYDLLLCREKKITNHYYNNFKFTIGNLACVQRNGTLGPKVKKLRTNTYLCSEEDYFGTKGMCQNDCNCNIRQSDMARIMDCSYKELSNFFINQSRVNFDDRYSLIINLTGNFLKEIPSFELLSKLNITTLLLSNNNISQVTVDRIPKNLQVLHLHNNNISRVTSDVIDYIKSRSLQEFTFRGNPIICDCHTRDFYIFVQAIRYHYKDLKDLTCKNMSRPLYQLTFNDLVCPPEPRHHSSIRNIFIFFGVVILLTIALLIWYFRKDIRAFITNDVRERLAVAYSRLRLN